MAWLAVDKTGCCNIYNCQPIRTRSQWVIPKEHFSDGNYITISREVANKIAGFKITFKNEALEI